MDELTRFVTSPIRRDLAGIDQQIEESAGRIRENYATLQRKRQLERTIRRLELSEKSLADQAANLRGSLNDVNEADRQILAEKPKYDAAQAAVESWIAAANQGLQLVDETVSDISDLGANMQLAGEVPAPVREPLATLRARTEDLLNELNTAVSAAAERIRAGLSAGSEHELVSQQVARLIDLYEESYDDVKERSTAHAAKLAELADVEKQLRTVGQSLRTQQRDELVGSGNRMSTTPGYCMRCLSSWPPGRIE